MTVPTATLSSSRAPKLAKVLEGLRLIALRKSCEAMNILKIFEDSHELQA
jgi:hypothetical protein